MICGLHASDDYWEDLRALSIKCRKWGVVPSCKPGTQEVEQDQEFKAILCYIVNSNPAWDNHQNAETNKSRRLRRKQTTTRSRRGKSGGWVVSGWKKVEQP